MAVKKVSKAKPAGAPKRRAGAKAAPAAPPAPPKRSRAAGVVVLAVVAILVYQIMAVAKRQAAQNLELVHVSGMIPQGLQKGSVQGARSIAGDKDGNVFFIEHKAVSPNSRLQKFDSSMRWLATYTPRTAEQIFQNVSGMDVDSEGRPWVLEQTGRIHILDTDLKSVKVVQLATANSNALAANPDGGMYVASYDGNKIMMVGADGSPKGEFGAPGTHSGDVASPMRLASDAAGNLYVLEALPDGVSRVKVFDKNHVLLRQFNLKDYALTDPDDMAADAQGHLVLNDAQGDKGVVIYDGAKGRLFATAKSTQDGMAILSPGALGVNRYSGILYVDFQPGMIPCTLPVPKEAK